MCVLFWCMCVILVYVCHFCFCTDRPLPYNVLPAYYFRDDEEDQSIFQESGEGTPKAGDDIQEDSEEIELPKTMGQLIDAATELTDASVKQHQGGISKAEVGIEHVGTVKKGNHGISVPNEAILENSEVMSEHNGIVQDHSEGVLEHSQGELQHQEAVMDHSDAVLKPNDAVLKQTTEHHIVGREDGDEGKEDGTVAKKEDGSRVAGACGLEGDGFSDDDKLVRSVLVAEEEMGDMSLWRTENSEMTDSELVDAVQIVMTS